jgi:hypothetical protein
MNSQGSSPRVGVDIAIAVVVAAVAAGGHVLTAGADATPLGVGLLLAAGLSVVGRRRYPSIVIVVTGTVVATLYLAGAPHAGPFIILPALVALATAAANGERRLAITAAVAIAVLGVVALQLRPATVDEIGVLWSVGWLGASVVAGEVVRNRLMV